MAVLKIETLGNPILRRKTRKVTQFDGELHRLIEDMIETMRAANGVGLAGPQVNQPLRLTVIETPPELDEEGNEIEGSRELIELVNPEIIWASKETADGIEGCLSIPGYVGEVDRHAVVRVRAQDRYGRKIRLRLHDWTARIAQHEIDHLDGVLYIDRLTNPGQLWTEEQFLADHEGETTDEVPVG
jgi:peptide deformylase